MSPPAQSYERLERIFDEIEAPFAFVDLDAMWANSEEMVRRAGDKSIRLATKSVRCRRLMEEVTNPAAQPAGQPGFKGLLTFTLAETLHLAEQGWENLLLGYPTSDTQDLGELAMRGAANPDIAPTLMVDSVGHLDLIESVLGKGVGPIRLCIDVDASLWLLGGRFSFGVKRSPLHTPESVVALAREIERRPKFHLVGLMAYEAQVAGVGDRPPGRRFRGAAIRWLKKRSVAEIAERRAVMVAAVSEFAELEFVNGGGTGSISQTAAEDSVTEIGAGSGLFAPTQFDHYEGLGLQPAAGFAIPVVRRPAHGVATALGGGYIASGGGDGTPSPWLPEGLELDAEEGAGEVQTPLLGKAADKLELGDRVYMRHVKAGELCERFNTLLLVQGDEIVDEVPTYRGEGWAFL